MIIDYLHIIEIATILPPPRQHSKSRSRHNAAGILWMFRRILSYASEFVQPPV